MTSTELAAAGTVDRLIASLTDRGRRDRTVLAVLAGYLLVWTLYGVIAKSNQDLHPDMMELIAWSRDLALGYPKHPPFAAVVVRGWFALFPITDLTYYLLAIATVTFALWIAWRQSADYLDPTKCVLALALLTFIPFFNFHALKFNVNTVLIPLWAVTTFWFLRSYRMLNANYAALAGISAALCMLTKYWSIFLLMGLFIAALSDSRRAAYFRSPAPWITLICGLAVLSPHIGWLQKHQFSPMHYAMLVHGGHSVGAAILGNVRYIIDSIAFASAPIIVVLLMTAPSASTVMEMAWPPDPERRLLAVAFWTTLLVPTVPALLWGVEIRGIWSMSYWTLLPILLLSPVKISPTSARWIVGGAIVFPLLALVCSPAVAIGMAELGLPPEQTQSRMLADRVEGAWHDATQEPLRFVAGDQSHGVLTYAKDRPELMPDEAQWRGRRAAESGIVLICLPEHTGCVNRSAAFANSKLATRKKEFELVNNYFGISGPARRYVVFVVPPR